MAPTSHPERLPCLVVGAGAAGLFCAGELGRLGIPAVVIDHNAKPAEKVRISGGGRCNFTNLHVEPDRFLSRNPHFAKSALARFTPGDFLDHLQRHAITWHEKTLGQLFCDGRSSAIVNMLMNDVADTGGEVRLSTTVHAVEATKPGYRVITDKDTLLCGALVIATGGLSIPKMGATGFAYDIARQFGHEIVDPFAGLVPFVFTGQDKDDFATLSGVSCDVRATVKQARFDEAMLFTHRGLSGPAILQVSSYWSPGEHLYLNLLSGRPDGALVDLKSREPRRTLASALEHILPKRLVALLAERGIVAASRRLADIPDRTLLETERHLRDWRLKPAGTEGWRTAEVTVGGIETDGLSSRTLESRHAPDLYFIGECVDVTGWLGGYNFQWAWASAHAAASAIATG